MDLKHEAVKMGRDEHGIYFLINFYQDIIDKVYVDEFFDEVIENDDTIDIEISSTYKRKVRDRPPAFFESLDPTERERIKKELNLQIIHKPIREHLNIYNYFMNYFKENPPRLAFKAKTIEEHKKWAPKVIEKVKELSHYDMGMVPLQFEEGPETIFEDIILKKYYITTSKNLILPAILCRPKSVNSDNPVPGIIAVHGHNKGKINTVGMDESSSNSYYGIDLAKRGYVTLSLDQWGWGEREGINKKREESPEKTFTKSAMLFGLTAIGIRSWEVSRAIDFLSTFDFVSNKFGLIGQSGGGTTAAFGSILDERINATVISGYFCNWMHSIFAMNHCICNFIPDIMNYVEFEDMIAARAPKPMFVVAGERDPIFPIKGVKEAYETVKKAYELYGKGENLGIDIIPKTGHVFRGDYAYPWLDKMLDFQK